MADDSLLEAVRGLHLAHPELGPKPLLAKLREQQPDLAAGNKEVREALTALKAEESKAAAAAPPAAAKPPAAAAATGDGGAPFGVALSLACFGCGRLPSEMGDGREKHPVCPTCRELRVPTTYWCAVNCPANPGGAWAKHTGYHKAMTRRKRMTEDQRGVMRQKNRETAAERARVATQTEDEYAKLMADSARYASNEDWRRSARAFREAITLRPDGPEAYFNLGAALANSGHHVEAAQRYLEARERCYLGSDMWAKATAWAFLVLLREACAEVAKPEWWSDEPLKVLSAVAVSSAPDDLHANEMRAEVLSGFGGRAWEAGPRSAAELREAATHYERAAALSPAPAVRAALASGAASCRRRAEAMLR